MEVDVVIINLARLGDLLQCQALIDDIHLSGQKAGIVCLENFAPAASLLRNVTKIWPLKGASLLSALEKNWQEALREISGFANNIRKETKAKCILNLTPSLPARLLAKLIASTGADIFGFGLDPYGYGINHGVWASFLSVAAQKRINAPFNVADMLRRLALPICGHQNGSFYLAKPAKQELDWAEEFIAREYGSLLPANLIAFQPGASEERRRWPVASFVALAKILREKSGVIPILLGSKSETALGEEFAASYGYGFVNAIGRTTLPQLASLLCKSRLLVTNDTGTMHLASGLGVPSLSFFLATAQPCDTGPLLPDCCCLEPAVHCHPCAFGSLCPTPDMCRATIDAQSASDLVLAWLTHKQWSPGISQRVKNQCRVWITGAHGNGTSSIIPVHDTGGRSLWLKWLWHFWRQLLDDLDNQDISTINRQTIATRSCFPMDLGLPSLDDSTIGILKQSAAIFDSLSGAAQAAAHNPKAGQLLLRTCEGLQSMLDSTRDLSTLAAFWREFRQTQGGDLAYFSHALNILAAHSRMFAAALGKRL